MQDMNARKTAQSKGFDFVNRLLAGKILAQNCRDGKIHPASQRQTKKSGGVP
jgi:hypothetical protein